MKSALFSFISHLQDHWIWLAGLIFMIEPIIDGNIEAYKNWAEKYVSRNARFRLFMSLTCFSIVAACFLSFKDEFELHDKDQILINGTIQKPGIVPRLAAAEAKSKDLATEIDGPLGYKARIADLEHSLGKVGGDLSAIQRSKPQVVVQTKEVPIVIPSGAQIMTPEERDKIRNTRISLAQEIIEGQNLAFHVYTGPNFTTKTQANA